MTDFDQCYDRHMQELQRMLPNVHSELTHDILHLQRKMTDDKLKMIASDNSIISIIDETSPVARS
ncbi:hypothetical protein [Nitrosopumilus sp.]|uniref:hypothetical protein n=1 Tax=Nitrosopumilus sp. TaxID=2024843 RepID=UPI003B5AEA74